MQPLQKSSTTLSWIVGPDISRTIINGNDLVTEEMLKNVSIGSSFLDNNVDIGIFIVTKFYSAWLTRKVSNYIGNVVSAEKN